MITRLKKAVRRLQSRPFSGAPLRKAIQIYERLRGTPRIDPISISRPQAPSRPERLLFIADYDPKGIPTITENIESWCRLSKFQVDILNLHSQRPGALRIPDEVNLKSYNGLIIHCTISYNIQNLLTLDEASPQKLADYRGVKIIMKQDEHYKPIPVADYIGTRGFDGVISVCRPQDVRVFYPQEKVGNARFLHALTGYVSSNMLGLSYPLTDHRIKDIGYRGSLQPLSFGRLAFEKRDIGDRFIQICGEEGLTCDISSRLEDRINGQGWFDFLGSIKGVLGVESGASIVDFNGDVERKVQEYQRRHPDASFESVYETILKPYENNAYFKAIAPRHLEAAATKTVQIMYEGDYSGVFQADRHYLALHRDFSNLKEVLARFADPKVRRELTECAYEEIILNPKYHYPSFVSDVDTLLENCFSS